MECKPVSPEGPIVITFQEDMLDLHFYARVLLLPYYVLSSLARHYFEDLDSLTKWLVYMHVWKVWLMQIAMVYYAAF